MLKVCGAIVVLALSAAPGVAADLVLSVDPRAIIVTPVREDTISLTARNAGPGEVSGIAVETVTPLSASQLVVEVSEYPACEAVVSTSAGLTSIAWNVPVLGAGVGIACRFTFRALPSTSTESTTVTWRIAAPGNTDPNPFNSRVQAVVQHWRVDRPADIALTLLSPRNIVLQPNEGRLVSLRLRNNGPSVPDAVVARGNSYAFARGDGLNYEGYDLFAAGSDPPCVFIKDGEGVVVFFTLIGPPATLAPGQSAVCNVEVRALADATGTGTLRYEAFGIGPGVYDPAPADNSISVFISYGVAQGIPVPVGWQASLAIALLIVLIAIADLRRRRIATTP